MDLQPALDVRPGELVGFLGADSRTTLAWHLLRQLAMSGERVVLTATSQVLVPRGAPLLVSGIMQHVAAAGPSLTDPVTKWG